MGGISGGLVRQRFSPVMGRRAPARDLVVLIGPYGDCILTVRRMVGLLTDDFAVFSFSVATLSLSQIIVIGSADG